MGDAIRAETVWIDGANGDELEAYLAQPLDRGKVGGVVVIHHMPGYDEPSKEITRRFAAQGYLAICPNLYSREGKGVSPDDQAAAARAKGGVPDDQLVGDVGGAASYLRALPASNGKIASIGYCSGGRQSFLAACSLPLQAAVDCYGAFVLYDPPEGAPARLRPIGHLAEHLSAPLLGLFGADDKNPTPAEVGELDALLTKLGKDHEFHSYDGAGHGFFSVNRAGYRPEAANDGWERIWEFFGRHLAA
jgi:carboxymethylenebutenolidase